VNLIVILPPVAERGTSAYLRADAIFFRSDGAKRHVHRAFGIGEQSACYREKPANAISAGKLLVPLIHQVASSVSSRDISLPRLSPTAVRDSIAMALFCSIETDRGRKPESIFEFSVILRSLARIHRFYRSPVAPHRAWERKSAKRESSSPIARG
jgi:hypothetical protein